jgi:hypothetical protein
MTMHTFNIRAEDGTIPAVRAALSEKGIVVQSLWLNDDGYDLTVYKSDRATALRVLTAHVPLDNFLHTPDTNN